MQVTRFGVGNFVGVIEAGKVKALAVSSAKRSPVLPNVPTFAEVGWGDYPGQGWWGLARAEGHAAGDRRQAVERIPEAVQRSEVRRVPRQAGGGAGADRRRTGFAAFLKQDRKDAETLIKIANTKKTEFKE